MTDFFLYLFKDTLKDLLLDLPIDLLKHRLLIGFIDGFTLIHWALVILKLISQQETLHNLSAHDYCVMPRATLKMGSIHIMITFRSAHAQNIFCR